MRVARADELSGIDSVELGDQRTASAAAQAPTGFTARAGPWDGGIGDRRPGIASVDGLVDACGLLQAGEAVLITAAAGGVGSAAVQIAAAMGARPIAVASPANHATPASYARRSKRSCR